MLFCIFVKKQGSKLFSSNGRVKNFSLESRKICVKKQPHRSCVATVPTVVATMALWKSPQVGETGSRSVIICIVRYIPNRIRKCHWISSMVNYYCSWILSIYQIYDMLCSPGSSHYCPLVAVGNVGLRNSIDWWHLFITFFRTLVCSPLLVFQVKLRGLGSRPLINVGIIVSSSQLASSFLLSLGNCWVFP